MNAPPEDAANIPAASGAGQRTALALPAAPRILIVMMSALGDAVHVLPVVSALKRHDPRARITWILQPGPASLVRGHPDVDEILIFERGKGLRAFAGARRQLAGRSFDLVVDLQVYFKASVVTALARAPLKLGFDRSRARDLNWLVTNRKIPRHAPQHVQDQYFEFLEALGVQPEPVEWKLGPWLEERAGQREFFRAFGRPAVSLVIGSSKPDKEWLPARWAELADALHAEFQLQPILVGGRSPRELDTEREILMRAKTPIVSTLGIPLRELVGVLEGSALVVSLDTGPMHMAVALDRPVISLMSTLNPLRVGPFRKFQDLVVDAFHDPGETRTVSAERRPGRMDRITLEAVLDRVRLWRARYAAAEDRAHIDGGDR